MSFCLSARRLLVGGLLMVLASGSAWGAVSGAPAGPSSPAPVPGGTPVKLTAPTFTVGAPVDYETMSHMSLSFKTSDGSTSGLTLIMTTSHRYRLVNTAPNGEQTLAVTLLAGELVNFSNEVTQLPRETEKEGRQVTLNRLGEVTDIRDAGKRSVARGMESLVNQANLLLPLHLLAVPPKAVLPGDIWRPRLAGRADASTSGKAGALQVQITYVDDDATTTPPSRHYREEIVIPFESGVDAAGNAVASGKKSEGKISCRLVFTMLAVVNAADGLLIESKGRISGYLEFEGSLVKDAPAKRMEVSGEALVRRPTVNGALPNAATKIIPNEDTAK